MASVSIARSYKLATLVGLLLITPGDDGRRDRVLSTSTDDRRLLWLLITLSVCSAMVDLA